MKLRRRKTIRVDLERLEELELHNLRLVESNEVLLDDVRELQGQLSEARERVCPGPGELCPNCKEYIWGDGPVLMKPLF